MRAGYTPPVTGERGRFIAATARGLDGAMIGYLASAFFVTVLYYPYLWFALGMTSALYAATVTTVRAAQTAGPTTSTARTTVVPGWRSIASGAIPRSSTTR